MADLPSGFQGFTFTPPPLTLNGQSVAGGLNFTAQNAIDQVDQASQAYSFIGSLNSSLLGFYSNSISSAYNFAASPFADIIGGLTKIGQGAVGAENTAAGKICTGFLGCLFG